MRIIGLNLNICDIQQRVGEIEEQFGHPEAILNQSVEEGRII